MIFAVPGNPDGGANNRLSLAMLTLTVGLAFLAIGRRRRREVRLARQLEAARLEGAKTSSASSPPPTEARSGTAMLFTARGHPPAAAD